MSGAFSCEIATDALHVNVSPQVLTTTGSEMNHKHVAAVSIPQHESHGTLASSWCSSTTTVR